MKFQGRLSGMSKRKPIKKIMAKKNDAAVTLEKTGAPDATFLSSLQVTNWTEFGIETTRHERRSLVQESTGDITQRINRDLTELADRVLNPKMALDHGKMENAAEHLSAMATMAARFLEDLSRTGAKFEIELAAARKHHWPVNLSLGRKKKPNSSEFIRTIHGFDKVKKYLVNIRLGESPAHPMKSLGNPKVKIFKKAAELLFSCLLDYRERGVWANFTPWAKDLSALKIPMTEDNVGDWWAVAKRWMNEQWVMHPEYFVHLKKACKHEKSRIDKSGKKIIEEKGVSLDRPDTGLFESQIKSHVIDLRLAEAFYDLVKPANL